MVRSSKWAGRSLTLVSEERREEGAAEEEETALLVRVPVPVLLPATVTAALFLRKELGRRTPPVSVPREPRALLLVSLAYCRHAVSHFLVMEMMGKYIQRRTLRHCCQQRALGGRA